MDFNLQEMLTLRAQGWSTIALGIRYKKDHTTIVYHCKKHGVVALDRSRSKNSLQSLPIIVEKVRICDKYANLFDEPRNPGKTYKQYVHEQTMRQKQKDPIEGLSL